MSNLDDWKKNLNRGSQNWEPKDSDKARRFVRSYVSKDMADLEKDDMVIVEHLEGADGTWRYCHLFKN